jgi:hypothetical protein
MVSTTSSFFWLSSFPVLVTALKAWTGRAVVVVLGVLRLVCWC